MGDRAGRTEHEGRTESKGRRGRKGEQLMVPEAEFTSYYGKPILNPPTWRARDIAGYFFLGGLAGAGSVLAAGAGLTGRPGMARALKISSLVSVTGSAAALIHDLGRPERFANMLRVFKPTSPMSVGSWLLAAYGPAAGAAAVLGSAAAAAGGMALIASPVAENAPARSAALFGTALEAAAVRAMKRRLGVVAETYREGKAGRLMHAAEALGAAGALGGALLGRRSRTAAVLSGTALLAASACTRFGVFHAGMRSAEDPKYTVVPRRERLAAGS